MHRKLSSLTIDNRSQRRFRRTRTVLLAILLLVSFPVIYEFGMLCVMRWKEMFGVGMKVDTPVLDVLGSLIWSGRSEIVLQTHSFFHQGTWSTPTVMLFALFWTVTLAVLLRRC